MGGKERTRWSFAKSYVKLRLVSGNSFALDDFPTRDLAAIVAGGEDCPTSSSAYR